MYKKIFIDANVILDMFEEDRAFYNYSVKVMNELFQNQEIELFISSDMISNIFYILNNRFKYGFDKTLSIVEKITDIYTIHSVTSDDIRYSIEICKKHIFKDYEDALQYVCALNKECSFVITNNPKDFKNSTIEIATTKELSQLWSITSQE